ncbi:MAG: DoxX family protein [Chitinophagales bacterium]|nr:DoxX family protein [Bacteroidota bacterium]
MQALLNKDVGLFIIRIGLGIMFMLHGFPKISGGVDTWEKIGMAMGNIGIHFMPAFWGFMAALAEFGGGICLILGILFRPATAMMVFTMFIAAMMHYQNGDGFGGYSHAVENGIVLLGLFFAGSGKYAIKISRK